MIVTKRTPFQVLIKITLNPEFSFDLNKPLASTHVSVQLVCKVSNGKQWTTKCSIKNVHMNVVPRSTMNTNGETEN